METVVVSSSAIAGPIGKTQVRKRKRPAVGALEEMKIKGPKE